MTNPNMFGNSYQFRGYCFQVPTRNIFALSMGGGGKASVDGGYRVRSEGIALQNIDSTAELFFSFDSTAYSQLDPGAAFSDSQLSTDRIYIKSGTTDSSCYVQMTVSLQNNWR